MPNVSRAQRLLRLVQVLRRYRQPVSAAQLAAELEVSMRSIYRDVQALREQGAAIEGEAGVGYVLRPGFLLPPLMFGDEEIEALVLGLRLTVEYADPALAKASAEVVAKLRAVLPKDLRTLLEETTLLAGPARARPEEKIDLREARRALREQRKVQIEYVDQKGRTSARTIWPIAIGFFDQARVVVAWCEERDDFRSFRTDRIERWQTQAAPYGRSRAALLKQWRGREGIAVQLGG